MNIEKVLSLIPSSLLESLAIETKVDYFAKKLQGAVMFKLLLHCILSHKDNSLRTMKSAYESIFFKILNKEQDKGHIQFSSISERLSVIEVSYFEKLFSSCVAIYKKDIGSDADSLIRFDSTIVALSSKLLNIGIQLKGTDCEKYKQIKFTVGYAEIPETVSFYIEQTYNSENVALKETILNQSKTDTKRTKIFDRGINSRTTYDYFTDNSIKYVSRINITSKYKIIRPNEATKILPITTSSLTIVSDNWCQFYGEKMKPKHLIRRVEAIKKVTNEVLVFITNIEDLTATDITELYKRRWDIEVFFRFIKQLLNFKHFISRNENGMKVVLYVTMIAAILLIAYKKENKLEGYKIAKQQFANDLEVEIIKEIVVLCGGSIERLNEILLYNSS
jgi:hypothetical protein